MDPKEILKKNESKYSKKRYLRDFIFWELSQGAKIWEVILR